MGAHPQPEGGLELNLGASVQPAGGGAQWDMGLASSQPPQVGAGKPFQASEYVPSGHGPVQPASVSMYAPPKADPGMAGGRRILILSSVLGVLIGCIGLVYWEGLIELPFLPPTHDDANEAATTEAASIPQTADPTPLPEVPAGELPPPPQISSSEVLPSETILPVKPEVSTEDASHNMTNPYWALPNPLEDLRPLDRVWSAQEEEAWRSSLGHPFSWQRMKTVLDIQKQRLTGSSVILWEALNDKNLWPRMRAAATLADFGIPLSLDMVEKALGTAKPGLIQRYFKRFQKQSTPGEAYLMRQTIRVADEPTRLEILKALSRSTGEARWLYLTAALYDQGPRIQVWMKTHLPLLGLKQERIDILRKDVETHYHASQMPGNEDTQASSQLSTQPAVPSSIPTQLATPFPTPPVTEAAGGFTSAPPLENTPIKHLPMDRMKVYPVASPPSRAQESKDIEFDEAL